MGEIDQHRTRVLLTYQAESPLKVTGEGHLQLTKTKSKTCILPFLSGAGVNGSYQLAVRSTMHGFDHLGPHSTKGTGHDDWDLVCHKALRQARVVESVRNLS
jgi:hypothetical protein